jgi:hypothetical protein
MVLGPGDVGREGRAEALLVGQPLVTLLCGDALADELVLRQVGIQLIEVVQIDDFFWKTLRRSPAVPSSEPVAALAVPATAPSASPPAPSPSSSGVESSGIVAEWAVPIQLTQAISPAAEAGEAPVEAPEADGDGERPGIARVPGEGQ